MFIFYSIHVSQSLFTFFSIHVSQSLFIFYSIHVSQLLLRFSMSVGYMFSSIGHPATLTLEFLHSFHFVHFSGHPYNQFLSIRLLLPLFYSTIGHLGRCQLSDNTSVLHLQNGNEAPRF